MPFVTSQRGRFQSCVSACIFCKVEQANDVKDGPFSFLATESFLQQQLLVVFAPVIAQQVVTGQHRKSLLITCLNLQHRHWQPHCKSTFKSINCDFYPPFNTNRLQNDNIEWKADHSAQIISFHFIIVLFAPS